MASSNPAIVQKDENGLKLVHKNPNRVQMGSNGFLYQFGSIRTHSQPKRTHGDPKQPIFHFFRVSILDISDGSGELFRKCSENGSGIFSGPNFCAEESSGLMGSKCQTEPRRPFLGPTSFWDQKVLPLSAKSQHFH